MTRGNRNTMPFKIWNSETDMPLPFVAYLGRQSTPAHFCAMLPQ